MIASGKTHSVREFCELAFSRAGLDWQKHVVVDREFLRPVEMDLLVGDPSKAEHQLGWKASMNFKGLVEMMVDADLARVAAEIERRETRTQ